MLATSDFTADNGEEENQYLAVPREAVLAYPEEIRRLLGYDRCPPGLGWHEMSDPYDLIAGEAPPARH